MDALSIVKNGIQQLAAELIPSGAVGVSLNWFGNEKNGITIDVTRTDEDREYRWGAFQVLIGDKISFVTRETNRVDKPIGSLLYEELVSLVRTKPKMRPGKRTRTPLREIGVLDCHINNSLIFSFQLTTDNMLSVELVWLGDRSGTSMIHIGTEVSPKPIIPKIAFGDEVAFLWR